jgi:hypothetical protein
MDEQLCVSRLHQFMLEELRQPTITEALPRTGTSMPEIFLGEKLLSFCDCRIE